MPAIDPNDLAIALKVMRIASDLPEDDEQSLQLQRSMSALPTNNELMMKRQVFSLCRVGSSYALWKPALWPLHYQLCPTCAADNRKRREASVDLQGRRALLTGGRAKIGMYIALKLLRDGANLSPLLQGFPGTQFGVLAR
ncbi:hypothetical protein FRC0036_01268 [Corynebacterium diphtheriae]|uniref:Uncharacterized protein n=1 Tax=Corynebacterium diphtheriae bv. mitis TaxID=1806053 RepID=A0A854NM28_CORDP|nr:hypothetical protein [Corynebacterium diphtheriae]ARB87424.1 hypothetical protein A6J36_03105 [Corynebacterium diphtheriae]AWR16018.1 hypothetical protein B11Q_01336 [Corynebacterium diphtheriae]KKA80942.1 hypothetical protein VN94_08085 [Corynebacterium diphtheriae]MBG9227942.1 hypothetical protein [Corynebacterium diphtheriae bv. gravis]MBG9246552.1 hypothetical protein [Corynebacterium diphtheriae bv. mitis]